MATEEPHQEAPGRAEAGPMQHLLSHFCEALEHGLAPLLPPIGELAASLAQSPRGAPAVLAPLREVADQLALLVDKMAEQQAYVLIFGPLKSGKSTLMNAVCAKYVSEVTCLPAYPCMVHVAHADRTRCRITRYDGTVALLDDEAELASAVATDHRVLMEAIRRCEAAGIDFEPQQHATTAIRRIDIRVPAGDLAESGAVLVDTPGLYSRMKFGYDRMTRDFRNAAACAIFVVKTDNLFLDHVFAEFEDLLELFGRIFLVVNLDSSKQDLQPDGTLSPSLEHADPQAVVRAFENLAMTAAVREAWQSGRLRIYPVDLLRAASARIKAAISGEPSPGEQDFADLLSDLTRYLNSNEYLRGFVADGLQRGRALLAGLADLLERDEVAAFPARAAALSERERALESTAGALARIEGVDWRGRAADGMAGLRERIGAELQRSRELARETLGASLSAWFEDDSSLGELHRHQLGPGMDRIHESVARLLTDECERGLGPAAAAEDLPEEAVRDLEAAGLELGATVRSVLERLPIAADLPAPRAVFDSLQLPVRRGVLDWLLLRRAATVRRRFFGPPEAPDRSITAAEKERRLGEAGRIVMVAQLEALIGPVHREAAGPLLDRWLDRYRGAFAAELDGRIARRRETIAVELEAVSAELEQLRRVVRAVAELRDLTVSRMERVEALTTELAAVDPAALGRPADPVIWPEASRRSSASG